jgi:hypothetical protein
MLLWQFDISPTADRFEGPTWLARLLKTIFMVLTFLGGFVGIGGTSMICLQSTTLNVANTATVAVDIGMTNNCLCYISVSKTLSEVVTTVVYGILIYADVTVASSIHRSYGSGSCWN